MNKILDKYMNKRSVVVHTAETDDIEAGRKPRKAPTEVNMGLKLKQVESDLSQKMKSVEEYADLFLSSIARALEVSQGAFFIAERKGRKQVLRFISGYAYALTDTDELEFEFGEGFTGQAAKDGKIMIIDDIPTDYLTIVSGLGKSSPASLLIFPVMMKNRVLAVVELASFMRFKDYDKALIVSLLPTIANGLQKQLKKKD